MSFAISDNKDRKSLSHRFRMERFRFFLSLLSRLPKPLTILDIGGTKAYWDMMEFSDPDVKVLLLNLEKHETSSSQFESIAGDATALQGFNDKSVDLVYSNSVIEHLFTWENQQKMADEVKRVARNYFIQTPNHYFFIEPHWVFPFFQFFPRAIKVWLTRKFPLGHIGKIPARESAERQVDEIKLLTRKQMQQLFPEAKIYEEKFLFFTKSIVAYHFPDK